MDKVREALEEAKNLLNALHEMDNKNTVHRIVGLIDDALASLAHPRPETWEEDKTAIDKLEAMIEGNLMCDMGDGEPCLRCDLLELVQSARIERAALGQSAGEEK